LPGDTVEKVVELDVPVSLPDTGIQVCTDFACALALLLDNKLSLELVQTDTMIVFKLDSVLVTQIDTTTVFVETPVEIKPKPTWRILTFTFGGLFLVFMFLVIFFATRKK